MTAHQRLRVTDGITPIALALLSAALLVVSLPSPDIGWLGWGALVPILLAIQGLSPGRAAALGLLTGVLASFGMYGWLFEVPSFDLRHAVLLALYVGAYPAIWASATSWALRRDIPLLLCAPVLWLLIDYLRGHAGFLALPWGTLAQTQHRNLALLQTASMIGEHGVTFLVALGNAALAALCLRRERTYATVALLILVTAHAWGATELFSPASGRSIRVAALQPNIQVGDRTTEAGREANLARLERLTREAASARPDLIVWPESAIPGDVSDPALLHRLQQLSSDTAVPLILGAAEVEKFATGDNLLTIGRRLFNTAHLFQPSGATSPPYRKRMLVPFAEYVPQADVIPWPEWLAPRVTELTAGDSGQLFTIAPQMSVAALICWENLFSHLARESVNGGAQLLVQLTNDVWFGPTAAPRQHNLMSVMRAVENRVPVVIASNAGPSQLIDGYGRVVAATSNVFQESAITGAVALGGGGTVYSKTGDWFVLFVLAGAFCTYVLLKRAHPGRYANRPSFNWIRGVPGSLVVASMLGRGRRVLGRATPER
ncbi:MAG TPA: apolipoprotein N-acyltransferase [Nitrospira sp.]|nr:apolipoprotein N-acyltransferase [Nitrospira sp.]HMW88296.1 apolipoprotein N-acyltransferase [Nitrospira sp.]HNA47712.1 apolipoprotein N-acyltransferase [Nitrospira sp.]HNC83628.1 apolipoprotein N-acyltransferase [Nitrospira sp.]HNI18146.1 apolipoprotein N-acyltransferase [Nitrospira sp.]